MGKWSSYRKASRTLLYHSPHLRTLILVQAVGEHAVGLDRFTKEMAEPATSMNLPTEAVTYIMDDQPCHPPGCCKRYSYPVAGRNRQDLHHYRLGSNLEEGGRHAQNLNKQWYCQLKRMFEK